MPLSLSMASITLGGGAGSLLQTVGGAVIGKVGTGPLANYTLAYGDDFASPLDNTLLRAQKPAGVYATNFSADRDRRSTSITSYGYIWDAFHTGHRDSNDGVAVGVSDVTVISGSSLKLKVREMTAGEKAKASQRDSDSNGTVDADRVLTYGALNGFPGGAVQGPFLWRYRFRITGDAVAANGNPFPAGWLLPVNQAAEGVSGREIDNEVTTSGKPFSGVIGTTFTTGTTTVTDGVYRIMQTELKLDNTVEFKLLDDAGTLIESLGTIALGAGSAALWYWLYDNLATTAGMVISAWAGKQTVYEVDWQQFWVPTATWADIAPASAAIDVLVNKDASWTTTLPSKAALWGNTSVTETLTVINGGEANAPLRSGDGYSKPWGEGSGTGSAPSSITFDGTTRALAGTTSSTSAPGMILAYLYPALAGASGSRRPYRVRTCVAPVAVDIPNQIVAALTPWSYQAPKFDVGNLGSTYSATLADDSPLPSWLTFNASTRTFSGTPPGGFTTISLKVTVTNAAGQTASDTFAGAPAAAWQPSDISADFAWDTTDAASLVDDGSGGTLKLADIYSPSTKYMAAPASGNRPAIITTGGSGGNKRVMSFSKSPHRYLNSVNGAGLSGAATRFNAGNSSTISGYAVWHCRSSANAVVQRFLNWSDAAGFGAFLQYRHGGSDRGVSYQGQGGGSTSVAVQATQDTADHVVEIIVNVGAVTVKLDGTTIASGTIGQTGAMNNNELIFGGVYTATVMSAGLDGHIGPGIIAPLPDATGQANARAWVSAKMA